MDSVRPQQSVLQCMWSTGMWRLFPCLLIYSIGFATLFPVAPTIITNGFASQAAGHPVDCQQFTPETSPKECDYAHVQAVNWNAWTSFVSGSVLSFLCAPAVGRLSDHMGRRPFMMAGIALALLPMVTLMFHCWGWIAIQWYYPMSTLNGMVSSFSVAQLIVADLIEQGHRATAIGYLSCSFSIGVMVGPILGGFISTNMAVYVCVAMICAAFLYILFFVDESAPRLVKKKKKAAAAAAAVKGAPFPDGKSNQARKIDDDIADDDSLEEPLLRREESNGSSSSGETDEILTVGEKFDFDPIPTAAPHTREHSQVQVRLKIHHHPCPCDQAICNCSITTADNTDEAVTKPLALKGACGTHGGGVDAAGCMAPSVIAAAGVCMGCDEAGCVPCEKQRSKSTDMLAGWRIIRISPWFQKLVTIWIIVHMTWEGAQDLLIQYLQLRLSFNTGDQARLLVLLAVCGLTIKLGLLTTLVRVLGEQGLLALGLTAYMLQDMLLAVATTKTFALVAISVGSLSCVCWPASVALQTKHVDPHDMGAVQGALQGVSSLATGVGPILFAWLFGAFSKRDDPKLPFFPEIVWYTASVMSLLGIMLTMTLHWSAVGPIHQVHCSGGNAGKGVAKDGGAAGSQVLVPVAGGDDAPSCIGGTQPKNQSRQHDEGMV